MDCYRLLDLFQWSRYEFTKSNSSYSAPQYIRNFRRQNLSMPIDMTVLLYLGNMTCDSGAFLESGYIIKNNSLNNDFIGEVGCYTNTTDFSWDNHTIYLSAIFVGY